MTEQQRVLVQQSMEKIIAVESKAGEIFYTRFFELDPSIKKLFSIDMKEQGAKLIRMIHIAVNDIENKEEFIAKLKNLGRIHNTYNVKDEYYETFYKAFIAMVEIILGKDFTPELRIAWNAVFHQIASVMQLAAHHAEAGL